MLGCQLVEQKLGESAGLACVEVKYCWTTY